MSTASQHQSHLSTDNQLHRHSSSYDPGRLSPAHSITPDTATPKRHSSEYSVARPAYGTSPSAMAGSGGPSGSLVPVKKYLIYYTASHINLRIVPKIPASEGSIGSGGDHDKIDPKKDAQFYVKHSAIRPRKPNVTIHAGATKDGAVLAVSHFSILSRTFIIGLGDPDRADAGTGPEMWWGSMREEKFKHPQVRFSVPQTMLSVDAVSGSSPEKDRNFVWKKTNDKAIGATGVTFKDRKLIDEGTGEIFAVYVARALSWKKLGELLLYKNYGSEFELVVLISLLSLIENEGQG